MSKYNKFKNKYWTLEGGFIAWLILKWQIFKMRRKFGRYYRRKGMKPEEYENFEWPERKVLDVINKTDAHRSIEEIRKPITFRSKNKI